MAAKHDGRHAANNLWFTHQALARAKGGRPAFQPKLKGPKAPPKVTKKPDAPEPSPAEPQES